MVRRNILVLVSVAASIVVVGPVSAASEVPSPASPAFASTETALPCSPCTSSSLSSPFTLSLSTHWTADAQETGGSVTGREGRQATATPAEATAPSDASEPARPPALTPRPVLAATGAAALAVPTSLVLGTLWGAVPSNLFLAALPTLLLHVVLAPAAVTFALRWAGDAPRRWWPVALAATGAHLAVFTAGILLGASTHHPGHAVAFGAADVVATAGAALLAYRFAAF